MDVSPTFAEYLADLLTGDGYWEGELIILPKHLCVAVLSLLQHLMEETHLLSGSLIPTVVQLNNLLGAAVHDQDEQRS